MRKLVLASLAADDENQVVQTWATEDGLSRLDDIVHQSFSVNAGDRAQEYSFQRIAYPLCELIGERFRRVTLVTQLKKVLAGICRPSDFFDNIIGCLEDCSRQGIVRDPYVKTENTAYDPDSLDQMIGGVVKLCLICLRSAPDEAENPRWPRLIERLLELGLCVKDESIRDNIDRCAQVVKGVTDKVDAQERARAVEQLAASELLAQQLQFGIEMPRETQPPPGTLRPEGPRHSNDHEDFREIKVLPTKDEISCDVPPYLPLQFLLKPEWKEKRGSEFVPTSVDRMLDIQFRLLREDMIAPSRRSIRALVEKGGLDALPKNARSLQHKFGKTEGNIRCSLFRNVELAGMEPLLDKGAAIFNLTFDHPFPNVQDYWSKKRGSKLLQVDSLIAVILNANTNDFFFAKVVTPMSVNDEVKRKVPATAVSGRSTVCVELCDVEADLHYLFELPRRSQKSNRNRAEVVILQVRSHFIVASEVALRSLQLSSAASIPFLQRIVPDNISADLPPPAFMKDETRFDLTCLLHDHAKVPRDVVEAAKCVGIDNLRVGLLPSIIQHLRMDFSQYLAFRAALLREVALIQGPPGTGKTFVGVEIVRALIHNSGGIIASTWQKDQAGALHMPEESPDELPALFPIVCICFTNHALDQFLEALVENKIVELTDIVRIGSRTKSEKLQQCTVFNRRVKESRDDYATRKNLESSADKLEGDIKQLAKDFASAQQQSKKGLKLLETFLRNYSEEKEDIFASEKDGFILKGGLSAHLRQWKEKQNMGEKEYETKLSQWWEDLSLHIQETLVEKMTQYNGIAQERRELKDALSKKSIRNAKVVGLTTTGCAKYHDLLVSIAPRVIVCEEAGEVMESHLLASLASSAESLILIGDHQQLRPKPSEYSLSVESGRGYDLDVSLFERLVRSKIPKETLHCQRRMYPNIAQLLRDTLYPQLEDGANVYDHPPVRGLGQQRVVFFDHSHREAEDEGSKKNLFEADLICSLAQYFVRQNYRPEDIAILTPYVGQVLEIRNKLANKRMTVYLDERTQAEADLEEFDSNEEEDTIATQEAQIKNVGQCVRLSTVDNFQGEEAELVLISTVRNNSKGRLGFLQVDNRVNVMLSRARHGMIVLGSVATVREFQRKSKKPIMFNKVLRILEDHREVSNQLMLFCENHRNMTVVTEPEHVPVDGGCGQLCGARLKCGHSCTRNCHVDNPDHVATGCREECIRPLPCGHRCKKPCGKPCGQCTQQVVVRLPSCMHCIQRPCYQTTAMQKGDKPYPRCNEEVHLQQPRTLPCGHSVSKVVCWQETADKVKCASECGRLRDECKHACKNQCVECFDPSNPQFHQKECSIACERSLLCGHRCDKTPCHAAKDCPQCEKRCVVRCEHSYCTKKCYEVCYPCKKDCAWKCMHKGRCEKRCAYPCPRAPCNERCTRTLKCGHQCPSLCGERCVDVRYCPSCAKAGKVKGDDVCDLIMFRTIRDLELAPEGNEEVLDNCLLQLECGHAFTVAFMDEQVKLKQFYGDNLDSVVPISSMTHDEFKAPSCANCREPWSGIFRYGRVLKWCYLVLQTRKWIINQKTSAEKQKSILQDLQVNVNSGNKPLCEKLRKQMRIKASSTRNGISPLEASELPSIEWPPNALSQNFQGHQLGTFCELLYFMGATRVECFLLDPSVGKKSNNITPGKRKAKEKQNLPSCATVLKWLEQAEANFRKIEDQTKSSKAFKLLHEAARYMAIFLVDIFRTIMGCQDKVVQEVSDTEDVVVQEVSVRDLKLFIKKRLEDLLHGDDRARLRQAFAEDLEGMNKDLTGVFYKPVTSDEKKAILKALEVSSTVSV